MIENAYGMKLVRRCCTKEMALLNVTRRKNPGTLARRHKAAQYHLYTHYTCTILKMQCKNVHICGPACIESYIKMAYPGDGKYVGFKECSCSKCSK